MNLSFLPVILVIELFEGTATDVFSIAVLIIT